MVHTSLRSSDNAVPRLIHHLSLPTSNRTQLYHILPRDQQEQTAQPHNGNPQA